MSQDRLLHHLQGNGQDIYSMCGISETVRTISYDQNCQDQMLLMGADNNKVYSIVNLTCLTDLMVKLRQP